MKQTLNCSFLKIHKDKPWIYIFSIFLYLVKFCILHYNCNDFIQKPRTAAANCPTIESNLSCWAVVFFMHSTYCYGREKLNVECCVKVLALVEMLIIFILSNASSLTLRTSRWYFFLCSGEAALLRHLCDSGYPDRFSSGVASSFPIIIYDPRQWSIKLDNVTWSFQWQRRTDISCHQWTGNLHHYLINVITVEEENLL